MNYPIFQGDEFVAETEISNIGSDFFRDEFVAETKLSNIGSYFFRDEFVAGMAETVLLPLLILLPTAQPLIEKIWESESNTFFKNSLKKNTFELLESTP